jgi:pyruvate dehydrogenase E1 component beta subunit
MMRPALAAVEAVQQARGARIEVLDLLTLAPLDGEAIARSVRKTGRAVVVQESPRSYGVAAEVTAQVNDRALLSLEAPVERVTGYDVVTPYFGREMLYVPSPERIQAAIERALDF